MKRGTIKTSIGVVPHFKKGLQSGLENAWWIVNATYGRSIWSSSYINRGSYKISVYRH
jgi:hypothetical protein